MHYTWFQSTPQVYYACESTFPCYLNERITLDVYFIRIFDVKVMYANVLLRIYNFL
jgi:hypothetical protein